MRLEVKMGKVIYIKYRYGGQMPEETYCFAEIEELSVVFLTRLIEEIKKENNYSWLFVEDIKILGDSVKG